jgi:hypothetical protein
MEMSIMITTHSTTISEKQIVADMINVTYIQDLPRFDPAMSLAEAHQMGKEAFEEDRENDDLPQNEFDITLKIMQGLLARQTPENWSLGFATGYVAAYLAYINKQARRRAKHA